MLESVTNDIVLRMDSITRMLTLWIDVHFFNILSIFVTAWVIRHMAAEAFNHIIKHAVRADVYPTKADREKRIRTLHSLANGIIRLIVYVVATILIIGEINPRLTTALFASAGLIGVSFGFGAQSLIRDLVSGIFIIIENQYRIGDEVTLTGNGGIGTVDGIVEDLSIRTTVLRDLGGNVHHMPNGNIGMTSNKTLGYSRINENIEVALNTDLSKLEKIIDEVGEELAKDPELESKVLEPPHLASVKGFTEDGVIVRVSAKTSPASQWRVRSEFYKRLKQALIKNKIKLAGQSEPTDNED